MNRIIFLKNMLLRSCLYCKKYCTSVYKKTYFYYVKIVIWHPKICYQKIVFIVKNNILTSKSYILTSKSSNLTSKMSFTIKRKNLLWNWYTNLQFSLSGHHMNKQIHAYLSFYVYVKIFDVEWGILCLNLHFFVFMVT